MKRSLIALAAVALSGAVVLPAAAASFGKEHTKSISLAGIDINSEAGAEIVYKRIVKAADRVCGVNRGLMSQREVLEATACADKAISTTVKALNVERLTALHASAE